jgi:hypothetical protein
MAITRQTISKLTERIERICPRVPYIIVTDRGENAEQRPDVQRAQSRGRRVVIIHTGVARARP